MDRKEFCSRAEAARILGLTPRLIDKIATRNGLTPYRVPGHSRAYYRRKDIVFLRSAAFPVNPQPKPATNLPPDLQPAKS